MLPHSVIHNIANELVSGGAVPSEARDVLKSRFPEMTDSDLNRFSLDLAGEMEALVGQRQNQEPENKDFDPQTAAA